MDRDQRVRIAAAAVGLPMADDPVPLPSDSNDAWKIGEVVLRVCWRGDRSRFERESLVLQHLPDEVPHAELLATGMNDDLSWTATRWEPGHVVARGWARRNQSQRRAPIEQLGAALGALHNWQPPSAVARAVAARHVQSDTSEIIGADVNPLPVDRALRLIACTDLRHVDATLIASLQNQLEQLRHIDPFGSPTAGAVVHGDAHLGNLISRDAQLVAILDYEWVRFGPPDLELQVLLRFDAAITRTRCSGRSSTCTRRSSLTRRSSNASGSMSLATRYALRAARPRAQPADS